MFAATPDPPYVAVMFTALLNDGQADYFPLAEKMDRLAAQQAGYLGIESTRNAEGLGITISYWRSSADAWAWRQQAEHAAVRALGRERFYAKFVLRVAEVHRQESGGTEVGA